VTATLALVWSQLTWTQVALAFCGITGIFLSQDPCEKRRKFACLFGLSAQPFWFYEMYQANLWGPFVLCFFYTIGWVRGFINNWVTPYWRQFVVPLL
jgi:hypothetical protein